VPHSIVHGVVLSARNFNACLVKAKARSDSSARRGASMSGEARQAPPLTPTIRWYWLVALRVMAPGDLCLSPDRNANASQTQVCHYGGLLGLGCVQWCRLRNATAQSHSPPLRSCDADERLSPNVYGEDSGGQELSVLGYEGMAGCKGGQLRYALRNHPTVRKFEGGFSPSRDL